MIKRIEHLGIAVHDLEKANDLFSRLLGRSPYKEEKVEGEGVVTSFFELGEAKVELLGSSDPESPIHKFLQKKGEGVHHVALFTDDLDSELERLEGEGFSRIGEPHEGADGKRICFLHPKTSGGVLVELCEDLP